MDSKPEPKIVESQSSDSPSKAEYHTPEITVYGDIRDLTQSTAFGINVDTDFGLRT